MAFQLLAQEDRADAQFLQFAQIGRRHRAHRVSQHTVWLQAEDGFIVQRRIVPHLGGRGQHQTVAQEGQPRNACHRLPRIQGLQEAHIRGRHAHQAVQRPPERIGPPALQIFDNHCSGRGKLEPLRILHAGPGR